MAERDIREALADEETRRAQLEGRLSEVETSAFAAERAFEELRLAQRRMRGALRALAGPEEVSEEDPAACPAGSPAGNRRSFQV